MAGKVEIFGGQLDGTVLQNAATESTLRELVNAINGMSGTATGGVTPGAGGPGAGGGGGMAGSFRSVSKVASTLANSLGSMTKLVVSGNQSLGTFVGSLKTGVKGIDMFVDATAGFVKYFEEAQGTLRELSKQGASFNNSVLDLKDAAAMAQMDLKIFQQAVQANAKGLIGYGQTLTQSAQRAAKIVRAGDQAGVTQRLMDMGMSAEESRNYIMEYSSSLAKGNKLRATSDTTLASASLTYYKELDALAKITGKSKDEQEDALKEMQAESLFKQKLARLDVNKQTEIRTTMAKIQAKQGAEAARIYRDQVIGVSVPLRKSARMQTALFNESTEANRRLADAQLRGTVSQQQINDVVNQGTVTNAKAAKGLEHIAAVGVAGGDAASAVAEAYRSVVDPITGMGHSIDEVTQQTLDGADAEAKKEQDRIGVMDKAMNQFQNGILRVKTALDELYNTVIRLTTNALEPVITWAGEFFEKASFWIAHSLEDLADWFKKVAVKTSQGASDAWFAIKEFFGPKLFVKMGLILENGFMTILANILEAVGTLLNKVGLGGSMLTAAANMRKSIEENKTAFDEAQKLEKEQLAEDKDALEAKRKNTEAELAALRQMRQAREQARAASGAVREPSRLGGTYDAGTGTTLIRDKQGNVVETRKGGHRNWRNNNPGNIEYGKFAISMGAIGTDGRFAIFPSMDMGYAAADALMKGKSYQNLSIADAIKRWAPPSENNTGAYQAAFTKAGFDITKKYSDLSPAEQRRYLETKMRIEGGKVGTVTAGPAANAGGVVMSPGQPGFDFRTASAEARRRADLANGGNVTPGMNSQSSASNSPGSSMAAEGFNNQDSGSEPQSGLNNTARLIAQNDKLIKINEQMLTAIKRLNGNVQAAVT
jgi:hypothetical protein